MGQCQREQMSATGTMVQTTRKKAQGPQDAQYAGGAQQPKDVMPSTSDDVQEVLESSEHVGQQRGG